MNYHAYLHSPWWTARKAAVIRYRGYRCERCGLDQGRLYLHHRTYARLGHEHPDDLELLCRWCHQREHGFERDHDVPLETPMTRLDPHTFLDEI